MRQMTLVQGQIARSKTTKGATLGPCNVLSAVRADRGIVRFKLQPRSMTVLILDDLAALGWPAHLSPAEHRCCVRIMLRDGAKHCVSLLQKCPTFSQVCWGACCAGRLGRQVTTLAARLELSGCWIGASRCWTYRCWTYNNSSAGSHVRQLEGSA